MKLGADWIGRRVAVEIDRPAGSRHLRHPEIVHPIACGTLPSTLGIGDHPINVYFPDCPGDTHMAQGVVIAVIQRDDDVEDWLWLVVSAEGTRWSAEEIAKLIHFQERFFKSRVILN